MTQPAEAIPPPQGEVASGTEDNTPETLTEAFKNGALALHEGERVPVQGANGEVGTVDAKDAQAVVDAGGSLVPQSTLHRAVLEAKYGGAGGMLGAAGAGLARGVSVGLSDPLAVGIGGEGMRERLAAYQELHPGISIGSEIVGAVAPALLSGGASEGVEGASLLARGARGLGALNEGVSGLGGLAERGITRLVGREAEGLAGRALQRGATLGARGAVEGAAYGLGGGISQEALREEDLGSPADVGERLFAATAHGALLGGALGGAVGVGGEVGKDLIKAATVKAHPFLNARAEESAFKSLSARKRFTSAAEKIPGGERAIGRTLLDDGIIEAGDTVESIAPKVAKAREAAGQRIEEVINQVAENETVPLRSVLTKLEERAAEFDGKLGYEAAAANVRKQKEALATLFIKPQALAEGATEVEAAALRHANENVQVPLKDLLAARRSLEGTINFQSEIVGAQGTRAAARTLEDVVIERGDALAAEKGVKDWAQEYKKAKLAYRRYALADDAVSDAVDRMSANAGHSLTDKIFAAHGATGAIMGVAAGHPAAIGGLLAGSVSKQIRTRGSSTAAVFLDKLASLGKIRTMTEGVDSNIAKSAKAWLGGGKKSATLRNRGAERDKVDVPQWQKAITAYRSNPSYVTEQISSSIAPVAGHAPNVAREYAATAKRAMAFLASKLPPPPRPATAPPGLEGIPALSAPHASTAKLNPQDAEKMARYIRATTSPESIMKDFAAGRISRESVEAAKEVYPALYAKMQDSVRTIVATHPERLTYAQKQELNALFDVPTDWSLTPDGIRTLQQAVVEGKNDEAQKSQARGQGGPNSGHAGATMAQQGQVSGDRLEMRGNAPLRNQ